MMRHSIREQDQAYVESLQLEKNHIECCERPTEDHLLADNWQSDPMNPSVCWRTKTAQELDVERDAEASLQIDETKLVKAVALWAAGHLGIAPAQARQEIKDIYKGL